MTALEPELEDAPERWESVQTREVPGCLWRTAREAAVDAARRERLALDRSGFTPVAAAIRNIEGWSMGQLVMTVREWRGVASIRFGGAPALLVAEVQLIDDEDAETALERGGIRLAVVPFAGGAEAARVALEEKPGYRI